MPYCTESDILEQVSEDTLIQLTDDLDNGVVDSSVVDRAIADADSAIDTYCQRRYTVPLSPVPTMVRKVAVDLAIYNLYSRRDEFGMPETREKRNQAGMSFLKDVTAGKIELGAATPSPTNTGSSVEVSSSTRVFSRDKMSGF